MPRNVKFEDLESGACRDYWKKGRLTWTQAKLLKKGDWLLVYSDRGEGYSGERWILGKFDSRTRYNGGDAVYVSTYPDDMPCVSPFYMHSIKLPTDDDMKDAYRWGRPLTTRARNHILKSRELVPDKQATLF